MSSSLANIMTARALGVSSRRRMALSNWPGVGSLGILWDWAMHTAPVREGGDEEKWGEWRGNTSGCRGEERKWERFGNGQIGMDKCVEIRSERWTDRGDRERSHGGRETEHTLWLFRREGLNGPFLLIVWLICDHFFCLQTFPFSAGGSRWYTDCCWANEPIHSKETSQKVKAKSHLRIVNKSQQTD